MEMIRSLIVDDERLARLELNALLAELEYVSVVAEASNVNQAISLIERHDPDLVFLDIEMPGRSGLDLARQIKDKSAVIFTTAYDSFAIEAFDIQATDYLLKPIKLDRLKQSITLARKWLTLNTDSYLLEITIKEGKPAGKIKVAEISFIQAYGHYLQLFRGREKYVYKKSLTKLYEELNPREWFRANRSTLVRLGAISTISKASRSRFLFKL
ncbi:MAG: response regulator transcription factor, partial [Bacteroidota bacterium]